MNSQDQMGVYQELQQKGYLNYAEIANAATSGVYGKMYQLISQYNPVTGQFGLENTIEARNTCVLQSIVTPIGLISCSLLPSCTTTL